MKSVFQDIYQRGLWDQADTRSGVGSTKENTKLMQESLPVILEALDVVSLLDIGCGDCSWISKTWLGVKKYTGVDVVDEVIASNKEKYGYYGDFHVKDATRDDLPFADAVLCRDVFTHWSNEAVNQALVQIKKTQAKWFISTTWPGVAANKDTYVGGWRPVNLLLPPFSEIGLRYLVKENELEKYLGIWKWK